MKKINKSRLILLKNNLDKIKKENINLDFIKVDLDDELNLVYYNIPIIFSKDFKHIGADVIHNKTKLDFYEICEEFFGINEFTKYLLFFKQSDLEKKTIVFNIEKDNNLKRMRKNKEKIIKN